MERGVFYLNNEQCELRVQVIRFVRSNIEMFRQAGLELDAEYSVAALRKRVAKKRWKEHAKGRSNRNLNQTRASRRKRNPDYDLFPQRHGYLADREDGKLIRFPNLNERYLIAYRDFDQEQTDLATCELSEKRKIAARWVLLFWIWFDADRAKIQKITDFQDIRWRLTDDGMPSSYVDDDSETDIPGPAVYRRKDGGFEFLMAVTAQNLLRKVPSALKVIEEWKCEVGNATNKRGRPPANAMKRNQILEAWDKAKDYEPKLAMNKFCEGKQENGRDYEDENGTRLTATELRKYVNWRSKQRKRLKDAGLA